jgi:hypothetical protein
LTTTEGIIIEHRQVEVDSSPKKVYQAFMQLGGEVGWLYWDWAWRLRGVMDRLLGGVGLRRGRRDSQDLRVGDAVDFWRVESLEPGKSLRLRAEMKVPGRAWLEFQVKALGSRKSLLVQKAYFAPKGLFGLLYWYGLYPIHSVIFSGLIREIKKRVED